MSDPAANVIYYGSEAPPPERTALRAGPLSLVFENGDLRYVKLGDREIVRRVYVAVRDRNWDTIPAQLTNLRVDARDDSFEITYDARHAEGPIDFAWQARIVGSPDGTVRFSMDGAARSTFLRNRIGFCVLHPARECAGAACVVRHADETEERAAFPQHLSPHQPFLDIAAITHEVTPGTWARVAFEGEVFEMEDQRNWIDASFKTYCTPLRLPFPVEVAAGMPVRQAVTISVDAARNVRTASASPVRDAVRFALGDRSTPLPALGLQLGYSDDVPGLPVGGSDRHLRLLRALNLSHLRVDVRFGTPLGDVAYESAFLQAGQLGVAIEFAIFLADDWERYLAPPKNSTEAGPEDATPVTRILLHRQGRKATPPDVLDASRRMLKSRFPNAQIGGGTDAYFTELNRNPPPANLLDVVCYSVNPQVHAFDNASLAETPPTIAATVNSARQLFGPGVPIAVTPVTLRPRWNPDATAPPEPPKPGELPSQVDVRQTSLFGAGWTLAALKYLAEGGAHSATLYETVGWRGVMEREEGSPLPDVFRSVPGGVFPLYHVLADWGEFRGGEAIESTSSDPLRVEGAVLRNGNRLRVMLANLTHEPQKVVVEDVPAGATVRTLDAASADEAVRAPEVFRARAGVTLGRFGAGVELGLSPYAVVTIDGAAE